MNLKCRKQILTVIIATSCIFLLGGVCSPAQGQDQGLETLRDMSEAFTSVADKAIPAVVSVRVKTEVQGRTRGGNPFGPGFPSDPFGDEFFDRFFRHQQQPQRPKQQPQQKPRKEYRSSQGSGFIISADGYILTNNHVVEDADQVEVELNDGRKFDAKVIGADPKSDVAVIKIDETDLPTVELGDSDKTEVGQWVIAIGNPFGLDASVTVGIISAKSRRVGITQGGFEDFLQTDAAINPGNSGGPLLTLEGKAIGMNTAIFSRSGGYMGIGFAIPINMAQNIKDQLIQTGKVSRGYLGVTIQDVDEDLAKSFGLEKGHGVLFGDVVEDSPAEKAGIKSGDIVLKVDGNDVKDRLSFRNQIAMLMPGTEITLLIYRDGENKTIDVKIGALSESPYAIQEEETEMVEDLGLQVQDLSEELAQRFGYEDMQGVIVTEVTPGSQAQDKRIQPGHLILEVNHEKVQSVNEFSKAVRKAKEKKQDLLLRVSDGKHTRYEVLRFESE